jgi:hypothetical protein
MRNTDNNSRCQHYICLMNIITAHFLSRIFTSFRNSTVHAVVMYALTVIFCGDQYLARSFKTNRRSSREHGVSETNFFMQIKCSKVSNFSETYITLLHNQHTLSIGKSNIDQGIHHEKLLTWQIQCNL